MVRPAPGAAPSGGRVNQPDDARPTLSGLAGRLRALRLATRPRVSQDAAARAAGTSQNKISRAEAGEHLLTVPELRKLARAYGADPTELRVLVEWTKALEPTVVDSRLVLQRGTASFQHRVFRAEQAAAHVRSFQPAIVVGALQTEEYVRVMFGDDADRIAARLRRNRQLLDDDTRRWTIVQTEGALSWCLGGPDVMAEQIDAMIAASRLPHIDLRIITHQQAASFFALHGFHLYDRQSVHIGTLTASALITDRADVERYWTQFERPAGIALIGDDARAALAETATRYRR